MPVLIKKKQTFFSPLFAACCKNARSLTVYCASYLGRIPPLRTHDLSGRNDGKDGRRTQP